jgi:dolichol-phosphate mannosyltransferase
MDSLFIVMPAYNEQENIDSIIDQWYPVIEKHGPESRLLIVDDGSTDETYRLICEAAQTRPALIHLTKANQGHGPTVLAAYRQALAAGADYIFQTDSDGQTLPGEFERLWDLRISYDMALGTRTTREDGKARVVVSRTLRAVVKWKFDVTVEDANCPFRLMNREVLEECLALIPLDYNLPNVALCALCAKLGHSMTFQPITFRPRQGGVNSIDLADIVGIGRRALRDFDRINHSAEEELVRRQTRPASPLRVPAYADIQG